MRKQIVLSILTVMGGGCASEYKYTRPITQHEIKNSITIDKAKDEVWTNLVPALAKTFFIINNTEKESGLINMSYSGDPERFIDCGEIYSYIKNMRGERTYRFAAATDHQVFEVRTDALRPVIRRMQLVARTTITVRETSPQQTQVSVHVKYILNKDYITTIAPYNGYIRWKIFSESMSFNTGETRVFTDDGTECTCNGSLEQTVLDLLREQP